MRVAGLSWGCLVVALVGCNAIFGIDRKQPFPPGEGGQGQGGDAGTGAGAEGGGGGNPVCADEDDDGVTNCMGDCDDTDPTIFPGTIEICGDIQDNNCDDLKDADICMGLGTFVSALTGDDTNPGTQEDPVASIGKGISNAVLINAQPSAPGVDVYVGQGVYPESLTVVEHVSLFGGYHCTSSVCDWARDTDAYVSNIQCETQACVIANQTITPDTTLDGFLVTGDNRAVNDGEFAAAVTIVDGSPTVSNNTIVGAVASCLGDCIGVGIMVEHSTAFGGPVIVDNVIQLGDNNHGAAGIILQDGATGEVRRNHISGGEGRDPRGILLSFAGPALIIFNEIHTSTCSGAERDAWGIAIHGGDPAQIDGNRINLVQGNIGACDCNNGSEWCGGIFVRGGSHVIVNNVVRGTPTELSAALMLINDEQALGTFIVNGNTLIGGGIGVGIATAIVMTNYGVAGTAVVAGRIRNNILQGGTAAPSRHGVIEEHVSGNECRPNVLEANAFFDFTSAYHSWDGSLGSELTVDQANTMFGSDVANLDDDCVLLTDYHLSPDSQCVDKGSLIDAPALDFENDERPQGVTVDIGADEVTSGQ